MNLMPNITCLSFLIPDSKPRVSKVEIEAVLPEFLVFASVKSEQLGWSVPASHLRFPQGHEQSKAQHLLAEISLVERRSQNGFVQVLELGKRELRRQQLEPNRLVAHLALQPRQGGCQDFRMVESQL